MGLPLVPDPTFLVRMRLSFSCFRPDGLFTYPETVALAASLEEEPHIIAEGIASGSVFDAVQAAIKASFRPPSDRPYITGDSMFLADIPTGAVDTLHDVTIDVLDVMLMADGSLSLFVNPLPEPVGHLRQYFAQQRIDAMFRHA